MSLSNAFLILGGVGALWFFARFVMGPRRGAPSLVSMFKREPKLHIPGLGPKAITTLCDAFRALARDHAAADGAMLAGPFAAGSAHALSPVDLVLAVSDAAPFAGTDWLERWPYIANGHAIQRHDTESIPRGARHALTLRGAPPIVIHVLDRGEAPLPDRLIAAIREGAIMLDDPRGRCDIIRRAAIGEATTTPGKDI